MATQQVNSAAGSSTQSTALTSTKVKVVSNVACYYAVGASPVAYSTGNCQLLPANVVRDINVGPGTLIYGNALVPNGNVVVSGTGPKIAFISASAPVGVTVTEVGYVDFTKVTN